MLFNLLLIRVLYGASDKSPPSKKQPTTRLNEQGQPPSLRHHHDAMEVLRQFQQRYSLERRVL